jgi:ribokinase
MSQQPHVCVVGSTNFDLTFRAVRLPKPGETLAGRGVQFGHGGKGGNQAVMAARLGARVTMIGKVGRDAFGEGALRNYREQGIDATHVLVDPERPTGVASIVVDDAGQNCILVVRGANLGLAPQDVRSAAAAIEGANVLLCQLEVPLETVQEALRIARAAKVTTILNPAPAVALPDEVLRLADLCVPNENEIELLIGQSAASLKEAAAAGWELQKRGPATVIVTLGERGAMLVGASSAEHVPAPRVEAVDSSGAGDAFIGALGVSLAEGVPLAEAVRRANVVAALSVTRPGTQASFPTRAEIAALPSA